jgi:hypothetical protein
MKCKYCYRLFLIWIISFGWIIIQGCGLFRRVPIQFSRTTQTEFFKQYYEFGDAEEAKEKTKAIMGEDAWDIFYYTKYGPSKDQILLQNVNSRKIYVRGAITLSIYLSPIDHDTIFVEGVGRYALVEKEADKEMILFTADFFVTNSTISIKRELKTENPIIDINISQFLVRHFVLMPSPNYITDKLPLKFKIQLEPVRNNEDVYRINYSARHDVIFDNDRIGFLEFDKLVHNQYKYIDLRGRNFLRKYPPEN